MIEKRGSTQFFQVYLYTYNVYSTYSSTTVYLQCILDLLYLQQQYTYNVYSAYGMYILPLCRVYSITSCTQHIRMAALCKGTNCMYRKNNQFHTCTVTHITMFSIVIVWACMSICFVLQLMSRKQLKNIISSITIVTQSEVQNVCSHNH